MIKYALGALAGGVLRYFVLYKLIGCSTGSYPVTSNSFISTIYGIVIGILLAGLFAAK